MENRKLLPTASDARALANELLQKLKNGDLKKVGLNEIVDGIKAHKMTFISRGEAEAFVGMVTREIVKKV